MSARIRVLRSFSFEFLFPFPPPPISQFVRLLPARFLAPPRFDVPFTDQIAVSAYFPTTTNV